MKIVRNQLLRRLAPGDMELVRAFLKPIDLPRHQILERAGEEVEQVYFLESGLCSVVVIGDNGDVTEAGHIGREGMTGSSLASDAPHAFNRSIMQIAGTGLAMDVADFRHCLDECRPLRSVALLFGQALLVQISHTLLATARYAIPQRLARWLLMCHDRMEGDDLELTHDLLAMMLTVRRSGVTSQLHILEGMHLIKASRGLVRVLDREGLVKLAAGSYGVPELEYARLFPPAGIFAEVSGAGELQAQ